ncbi:uncharacterized protein LOC141851196 [Brevipalpus obovatus]|uniref:uncharacterized protein LOC141851196 n=1 Tax=Brevipalpus obovatus TaxID=246614 RepID=UPI003D9ECF38
MSTFDEKENEILPSLDVGRRKRSSILKSVGNVPTNKKKKLSFSTIQYQEVFADGTSRVFCQSINDISATESLVEPSKIFPNDDMDEDSSGDDLLNKTKYFSNDDLSLDSQSDGSQKIAPSSQPLSEMMSITLIDPVPDQKKCENDPMVSITKPESPLKECTHNTVATEAAQLALETSNNELSLHSVLITKPESPLKEYSHNTVATEADQTSLEMSTAKLSPRRSSVSFAEEPQAVAESEAQSSLHIADLTQFVATGQDETQTSIGTQRSSSRRSERLSLSNVTKNSFTISQSEALSTHDYSVCALTNSIPRTENVDNNWPEFGEVTEIVDNKSVAPVENDSMVSTKELVESPKHTMTTVQDDTQMNVSSQHSSSYSSEKLSLSNVSQNSFAISENETFSTPERSICAATNSTPRAENVDSKWREFGEVTVVVDSKSVSPDQGDSMVSTTESTLQESKDNTIATEADQISLEISNIEFSLRRSSASFVEEPQPAPESESQPGLHLPDLTNFVATGQDETQTSIGTQRSSSQGSERLSLSHVSENSFAISVNETFSTPERSICAATNSTPRAENVDNKWPEFGEVTVVIDNKSVSPDQDHSMVSITESESTLKESHENTIATEADQLSLEISNIEFSLRRSSGSFVEESQPAPESESQSGLHLPDLTNFVATGQDDTLTSISSTVHSSSHGSRKLSSSNVIGKSLTISENETLSMHHSTCTATNSIPRAGNLTNKWPDFCEVTAVVDNDKSISPDQDHSLTSITESESTLQGSKDNTTATEADQISLETSKNELSLHSVSIAKPESPLKEYSHNKLATEAAQLPLETSKNELSLHSVSIAKPESPLKQYSHNEVATEAAQLPLETSNNELSLHSVSITKPESPLKEYSHNEVATEAAQLPLETPNNELSLHSVSIAKPESPLKEYSHNEVATEAAQLPLETSNNELSLHSASITKPESPLKEYSHNTVATKADQTSLEMSTAKLSPHRSSFFEEPRTIPEPEMQSGLPLPDLTHFAATGQDDAQMSIGTVHSLSHGSKRVSSCNTIKNSFTISQNETLSAHDGSICATTNSIPRAENVNNKWPEFGEVTQVVDNRSVVPEGDDSMISIPKSESTLKESSDNSVKSGADKLPLDISNIEFSLRRSCPSFVEASHAIPQSEMHPSLVTHTIFNGQDETLFSNHHTLPFNRFTQTYAGAIKPSVVSHYFGQAVSVYIQYIRISASRDKILEFSWFLGFKNGAPFVATSDSGDEIIVKPENRKMLIIVEKLINTELSKVEKTLDSITSHRELFQRVEKIFDRVANLVTELVDLWQRCDGKLLSKSENSFGCGFHIEGLKEQAMVVTDLNLQEYPDQKVSVHLRIPSSDKLLYTTISPRILDCCRAVDPSVNKLNYLRRVVKSAEDFILDCKKQREVRIRCACSHSEKLCAIISAPMPDVDRATLVEKVADVLTSSWDDVPLYKRDPSFRKKIRHSLHRNVRRTWEAIQLKYS